MQEAAGRPGTLRVEKMFEDCRKEGRTALLVYLCGGYPDLEYSEELIHAVLEGGADLVEIGMPFSDPLADGPAIQTAAQEALAAGTTLNKVLAMGARIRECHDSPLMLMTYYNPVLSYGKEQFLKDLAAVGSDGLLVPDLPLEESTELAELAGERGLCWVPFAAPTSTFHRLEGICSVAEGFIYCISRAGTTGKRLESFSEARELARRMRQLTSKPIALGFGIAEPDDVAAAAPFFDGVIVGSAIIRLIARHKQDKVLCLQQVREFVSSLKQSCFLRRNIGSIHDAE